MNTNRAYESVIIFNTNLDEAGINTQINSIEKIVSTHGGSVSKKEVQGKKELEYHMDKKKFGNFVELEFDGDNTLISDLERQLNINDNVIRFLNVLKN